MDIQLRTRPASISKLIHQSFQLYQVVFVHVFFLALSMSVIAFTPRLLSLLIGQDIFYSMPYFSPHKLWLVLIDITALIFFSAMLWRIRCFIRHDHETILEDMNIAFKKMPSIIIASLLQIFFVIMASIAASVFYFILGKQKLLFSSDPLGAVLTSLVIIFQFSLTAYVFFLFYYYLPLIVLENKSILDSLKQSAALVWNHWWRTFWVQIIPWIVYLIVLVIVKYGFMIDIHIYFSTWKQTNAFPTFLHIILFALFLPWLACVILVQLNDLEVRKKLHKSPVKTVPA